MRKVMYEDCNNNASFLKRLFIEVQALSNIELIWSISNLDFIPVDKGDFVNGIPGIEMEELSNFQKRILDEHTVIVTHNVFLALLENIRTIYDGKFEVLVGGGLMKIKVFDGDIIEVDGEMENELKLS